MGGRYHINQHNKMTKEEFKNKHFRDSFYWITDDNFEPLQEIAVEMGLTWHTGDREILPFAEYSRKNLWMSPDGVFQALNWWTRGASYGEPVDFKKMVADLKDINSK